MSTIIRSGDNKPYSASVDDHGRLSVAANIITHEQHHATYHKNLYIMKFDTTLQDGTETPIAFFKNVDSTKDFEVYVVETASDSTIKINWHFEDEYTSGGSAVTPINTNRGTGLTLSSNSVEVYEGGASGDLVLDSTDRVTFHTSWQTANESHEKDFKGALVLPGNTSGSMTAIGAANDKISVMVIIAYHDAGTVL